MRYYLAAFFAALALGLPWMVLEYPSQAVNLAMTISAAAEKAGSELAAAFVSHNPVTVADLQSDYAAASAVPDLGAAPRKVRILIVPGHEPGFGGAEYDSPYGHVKERDFTVELAQDLISFLDGDSHFRVFTTRDRTGWTPAFADYFKNDWNDIVAWEQANKADFLKLASVGAVKLETPVVAHASAPEDVAIRLYGIDKWADDNNIDLVIHIHFNDYPGHGMSEPGKYSGFAIYVPESQYSNGSTTQAVAEAVFKSLAEYNPVSDLYGESSGIVPDQDLIAVGAFNTVNAASMLIEYAYIYEPQLDDPSTRDLFLRDLAYQTYAGLRDFFDGPATAGQIRRYDSLILPHYFSEAINSGNHPAAEVYALQTALAADGEYPPAGKSMNDCPRTGGFGPCTKAALAVFQAKHGITGEDGEAGPKTIDALNGLFSFSVKAP